MSGQSKDESDVTLYMQVAKLCERTKEMSSDISDIKERLNHLNNKVSSIEKDLIKVNIFWKLLTVLSPLLTVIIIRVLFGEI